MAFASISMGQYVPVDSPVHSLDPRAKLLSLMVILGVVFPSDDLTSILCCAAVLWGLVRVAGLSLKVLLKSCRSMLFLAFFSFLFNFGAVLWDAGGLAHAADSGAVAAARLLLLVFFAMLLPLTTSPIELTNGLESLLSPFMRFGFPAHEFAMMMGVALRFIPLLMDETDRIVKAQVSRGAKLDQGGAVRRVIAFFPVLIPLFVIIFRRADDLALAMEARGYRGGGGRTKRCPLVWKKRDSGVTIFVIAAAAGFAFFRSFLP